MTDCNQSEIEIENLNYYLKGIYNVEPHAMLISKCTCMLTEKRLIHSSVTSIIEKSRVPLPLLVVSPNHGKVKYKWEYKSRYNDKWTRVEAPPYTCLLIVDTPRQYRCTVDEFEEFILFDVKGKHYLQCIWLQTVSHYSRVYRKG